MQRSSNNTNIGRRFLGAVMVVLAVIFSAHWFNSRPPPERDGSTWIEGAEQTDAVEGSEGVERRLGHDTVKLKVHSRNKLYLFTYYRSGSTILGEMFNQNDDVFYFFEPLAGIQESLANSEEHVYQNGTLKKLSGALIGELHWTLSAIYQCDLETLPESIYRHRFMWNPSWAKSRKMADYWSCLRRYGPRNMIKIQADARRRDPAKGFRKSSHYVRSAPEAFNGIKCRPRLRNNCLESEAVVVKDIRIPMADMEYLLDTIADLRIVYQIRDPRAILHSQWPARSRFPQLPFDAIALCTHMMSDFKAFQKLFKKFPDRIKLLKFEDFAENPEAHLSSVYEFAGMSLPDPIRSWVWTSTHGSRNDGAIGTTRQNATEVAYSWRTSLSPWQLESINHECKDVLSIMNYDI